MCSKSVLFLSFFFQVMLLNVLSSFFPSPSFCRGFECMCGAPPILMNIFWSPIPGNPKAVLNPHGPLAICEGTFLGYILRSRKAVSEGISVLNLTKSCQSALQMSTKLWSHYSAKGFCFSASPPTSDFIKILIF